MPFSRFTWRLVPVAAASFAFLGIAHASAPSAPPGGNVATATMSAPGAEIYEPGAGRFTPAGRITTLGHSHTAGSLAAARAGHIAIVLSTGKVLIAGGVGPGWSFLSSAELSDPATSRFSPTGLMTIARESRAAVRLQDGRVLIVGGHRGRRENIMLYTWAETYDVGTGTFRRVGYVRVGRHRHDAVLLRDGTLLTTGGTDERDSDGVCNSAEMFNPATGTFADGPLLKRPRYKHNGSALMLPNGRVLFAGGSGNGRGPQAAAWIYRP